MCLTIFALSEEDYMNLNDNLPPGVSLDTISRELISGLPHELSDPYAPDKPWTEAVRDGLQRMGKDRGLLVFCHGSPDQGEWLLDLIWMNAKDWRIELAVESEWSTLPAAIEDDFGKLMSIKARRKLMLFNTRNHIGADRIMERIKSAMLSYPYHLAGEEYMALEVTAPGAFRYYLEVPSDGRLESATFNQMGTPLPWPWAK